MLNDSASHTLRLRQLIGPAAVVARLSHWVATARGKASSSPLTGLVDVLTLQAHGNLEWNRLTLGELAKKENKERS